MASCISSISVNSARRIAGMPRTTQNANGIGDVAFMRAYRLYRNSTHSGTVPRYFNIYIRQIQIFNRPLVHICEQSAVINGSVRIIFLDISVQIQAADRMAVSIKDTGKRRLCSDRFPVIGRSLFSPVFIIGNIIQADIGCQNVIFSPVITKGILCQKLCEILPVPPPN